LTSLLSFWKNIMLARAAFQMANNHLFELRPQRINAEICGIVKCVRLLQQSGSALFRLMHARSMHMLAFLMQQVLQCIYTPPQH
jgi:hypothetical protein